MTEKAKRVMIAGRDHHDLTIPNINVSFKEEPF
jgi:hypothetical protein